MTPSQLVSLFDRPAEAARQATAVRARRAGDTIEIREAPASARTFDPGGWPAAAEVRAGDYLIIRTDPTPAGRMGFARWLDEVAGDLPPQVSVALTSTDAAGLHRLWCFAAARIRLPSSVRVEARHDLVGIRLAQLALGFGVDVLSGPTDHDRRLPVAGVTRPNENTPTGLATLVRQAGLSPQDMNR